MFGLRADNADGLGVAIDARHGGTLRGAVHTTITVVDPGGEFLGFGDLGGLAPVGGPVRADGAGFADWEHFCGQPGKRAKNEIVVLCSSIK